MTPLAISAASIAFNPIFWNVVARAEHKLKLMTRILGPYNGCYLLALTIFSLGLIRDHFYLEALKVAPTSPLLLSLPHKAIGAVFFGLGNLLVVSSMWALGVTGTYLGDYFGILMKDRVTSFPFNVTDNPMYYGSVLSFVGTAFWYAKPLGFVLSAEVLIMYVIALRFEEPYTAAIYAKRDRDQKKK
ncbi:phospholipid methyltransferase-domain-containing protein [Protomyces lactucae-debilis]|uniref:Phosphatidyl-N-methylethanolamine N-methyltransferase n=1 Tax=Protomyces lactucae-debilis TaxID=2754530 RepID=A0A1Y2EXI1_PROLT|nr:phospholipid methyltransferase-domain-containing protein [Protomyces lactucae-debilis]ORY76303.1 phospholipid methyltransferase-domain-containing protein [Protomyces lactucae-debilis]